MKWAKEGPPNTHTHTHCRDPLKVHSPKAFSSWQSCCLARVSNAKARRKQICLKLKIRTMTHAMRRVLSMQQRYVPQISFEFCCTEVNSIAVPQFTNPNYSETSKLVYTEAERKWMIFGSGQYGQHFVPKCGPGHGGEDHLLYS